MDFKHKEKKVYTSWGNSLAQLHRASQMYQPKEYLFKTWKDLWQETRDYAEHECQDIKKLYQEIDAWFTNHPITEINFGLTHGDHRPGNVLYDGQAIHIIDFDEPVYHWFISDIAMPFLDLCNKPYHEWKHLFEWFIEGYRSILPIEEEDLKCINWFTQMKSLGIYLWCKNEWSEATAPGGRPRDQWLAELRHMALTPIFP
jgi:Ser/Thr protein kinase RdoA (MazF antagonist)